MPASPPERGICVSTAIEMKNIFGKTFGRSNVAAVVLPEIEEGDSPEVQSDAFVGQLFFFSIPATLKIAPLALAEGFKTAGIDSKYLPQPIHPSNAFRSASSTLKRDEEMPVNGHSAHVSLLVREVGDDATNIVRHIVVEIADKEHVRLLYTEAAQLELVGSDVTVSELPGMAELPDTVANIVRESIDGFPARFSEYLENLNDGYIRRAITAMMRAEHIIRLRRDGVVYFALQAHKHVVDQLADLFEWMQPGSAEFRDLPLIDVRKQRQMVVQETARHVHGEVDNLVREIDKLLLRKKQNGAKIRSKTVSKYLEELGRLTQLVTEYRQATGDKIAEAVSALDLLRMQATELQMEADD